MLQTIIATDRISRDPEGRQFLEFLVENSTHLGLNQAVAYYDFPTYPDYESVTHKPDILIFSKSFGIQAIRFASDQNLFRQDEQGLLSIDESLTQFCSTLIGRLLRSRDLRKTRTTLKFDLTPILFAPALVSETDLESKVIASYQAFERLLAESREVSLSDVEFAEARSVIEGAKALTRLQKRVVDNPETQRRAYALSKLESEISNFDEKQRYIALSLVQGPQRIRGLAGSGKTVILAMKVAQIHLNHPEANILFTYYTRSLETLLKGLVTRFYRHYREEDPDWEKVHIRHGWGRYNKTGAYSGTAKRHGIVAIPYLAAKQRSRDPFDFVCKDLLSRTTIDPFYDYILIDEGQDFPSSFYELCYFLAKGDRDKKNIIWAYDELQNILNVRMRTPHELFGIDTDDQPRILLERARQFLPMGSENDIVLSKCYRNQREVLVTAHALGFGIYGSQIVQMLEGKAHWEDVGYEVISDELVVGKPAKILRPEVNSPLSLNKSEAGELIRIFTAKDFQEEVSWVVSEITGFMNEGLKPEDILVVGLDDRNAQNYFKELSSKLSEIDVETNNIIADPYSEPPFTMSGRVTLSTVYRAKGNEAAVVFAIGIDAVDGRVRSGRNKLFAAFTRSKAWLRISGVSTSAQKFNGEVTTALQKFPYLEFVMPDPKEVETIQRDLSKRSIKAKAIREKYFKEMRDAGFNEDEIAEMLAAEAKNG